MQQMSAVCSSRCQLFVPLICWQEIPGLPDDTFKSLKKSTTAKLNSFTSEFDDIIKRHPQKVRQQRSEDLPGKLLGFDIHIDLEIEKSLAREAAPGAAIQTMDRDELAHLLSGYAE